MKVFQKINQRVLNFAHIQTLNGQVTPLNETVFVLLNTAFYYLLTLYSLFKPRNIIFSIIVDNTSASSSSHLLSPSRIFSLTPVSKPTVLIRGTQTSESRKHKTDHDQTEPRGKRLKISPNNSETSNENTSENNTHAEVNSTDAQIEADSTCKPSSSTKAALEHPRRERLLSRNSLPNSTTINEPSTSGFRIRTLSDQDNIGRSPISDIGRRLNNIGPSPISSERYGSKVGNFLF